MTYDLGLAKAPGNDIRTRTRLEVSRMVRASRNELRRRERLSARREQRKRHRVPRDVIMAHLYWHCVEQRHKFRESRAIAGWYDRVGLYALERSRRRQIDMPNVS